MQKVFVFRGKDVLAGLSELPRDCSIIYEDSVSGAIAALAGEGFQEPAGARWMPLREYFASMPAEDAALASRMKGLVGWISETKYCSRCGAPLSAHPTECALLCPDCGKVHYPRISPCIITVIERGDEILLLRHRQRNQDIFACLAGFVETGESLEEALRREVREEVGLEIRNIRYAGSQGWPFPDQLMVGFYAEYASGDIHVQESEITEAGWFRRDALPPSPGRGSISYKLIHYQK